MGLITAIAIYCIIWWLCLFTVLPWGAQSHHEAGVDIEPGNAPSAPLAPRIGRKFAITTAMATVVFAFVYALLVYKIIPLDSIPFLPEFKR